MKLCENPETSRKTLGLDFKCFCMLNSLCGFYNRWKHKFGKLDTNRGTQRIYLLPTGDATWGLSHFFVLVRGFWVELLSHTPPYEPGPAQGFFLLQGSASFLHCCLFNNLDWNRSHTGEAQLNCHAFLMHSTSQRLAASLQLWATTLGFKL